MRGFAYWNLLKPRTCCGRVKCNWTVMERSWLHRDSRDNLFSFIYLCNLLCFRPWEKCYQVIRSRKAFPCAIPSTVSERTPGATTAQEEDGVEFMTRFGI